MFCMETFDSDHMQLMSALYQQAIDLATEAHFGQVDKAGNDYILHPMHLATQFEDFSCKIVALLHDVIEDTEVTAEALHSKGFTSELIAAIVAITKVDGEEYEQYLERVKANEWARLVKLADLRHNMDLSRLPNPNEKDFERIKKYQFAVSFLSESFG